MSFTAEEIIPFHDGKTQAFPHGSFSRRRHRVSLDLSSIRDIFDLYWTNSAGNASFLEPLAKL
jgi:hypothetical protein